MIINNPHVPQTWRVLFQQLLARRPANFLLEISGSDTRGSGGDRPQIRSSASITVTNTLFSLRYSEEGRHFPGNFESTRGSLRRWLDASAESEMDWPIVISDLFGANVEGDASGESLCNVSFGVTVQVDLAGFDRFVSDEWAEDNGEFWKLLELAFRPKTEAGIELYGALLSSLKSVSASVPASSAAAPSEVAAPIDPLAIEEDTDVFVPPQPPADPMAQLSADEQAIITRLQQSVPTMEKGARLRGDELRAALSYQKAGGRFTRTRQAEGKPATTVELEVNLAGDVRTVVSTSGLKPVARAPKKP